MAATSTLARTSTPGRGAPLALAVADASWFTTENLFREVQRPGVSTLLLKCTDFVNAWRGGRPPWEWRRPLTRCGPGLWQRDLVMPSGWMKRYPAFGMRPIGRSIREWRREVGESSPLALVMTYPHYLYLRDIVRPDRTVYYNIDDYSQYWPGDARRVNELERQAVRESDLTVCVSALRARELSAALPEASHKIRHLPHGAPTAALPGHAWARPAPAPADLAALPGPLLGYVGTMEDRVDWALLDRLAAAMPGASVVLVGKPPPPSRAAWHGEMTRCLARPNVHPLGWRPQEQIAQYNRAFDVCLIPYKPEHPFNRVCSPAKIMDYMATGRPIVSTALPECTLYAHLFDVAPDGDAFVAAVRRVVASGSDDGRSHRRYDWAAAHTCRKVADQLLDWLPD